MANYYYARVRVYVSTNDKGLSPADLSNNLVKANPVPVSDASSDGTSKKQYAWYVVDVYKSTISSFLAWSALPSSSLGTLLTGDSRRVTFNLPTKDTHYPDSDNVAYYSATGSIISVDSHLEWTFSNNVGVPRSVTPSITVYQKDSGSETQVTNVLWVNTANKAPTIKFTGAGGSPTYPSDAVATWIKTQYGADYAKANITISSTTWSICNKQWCYMIVDNKDASVTLWYSDENATAFTMALGKKPAITDQPKRQAWNSQNAAAYIKAIDATACKGVNAGANGDPAPEVPVAPPTDDTRWNPPPHVYSRSVPYGIFKKYTDPNAFNDNYARATLEASEYSALKRAIQAAGTSDVPTPPGYSYLQRGRIFQDLNSAAVLNTVNATGKPSPANEAKQWGFRFMYNPTTISYNTSANNSIDWALGSKDSAALLSGNQTVTIQIYLNRIIDLSYLNAVYGYGYLNSLGGTQISVPAAYGRNLTPDEYKGIMSRGTEYDLEFLYRCLTGNPLTNNPLLNSDFKDSGSADIGYITGIPLWMYLNDNLRYFGSVASIGVNHAIFNTEMVPMLSVVDISFSRYPAYNGNAGALDTNTIHTALFPPANSTSTGTTS